MMMGDDDGDRCRWSVTTINGGDCGGDDDDDDIALCCGPTKA